MIKKTTIAAVALLAFAFSAVAEMVSQETALAAAEGFIRPGGFGARLLPDRSVSSAIAWGNLWIVALEPSGYIEIAGSTKCAPILSFSPADFAEPEVGSPFAAKLTGDSTMVETKEADDSLEDNPSWAKYTAPAAKKRTLLASAPSGTTSVVGPLMNCGWGQNAPFNDLSPLSSLCGCMATAAGQEHRYWRWPYRYEKSRQGNHGLRNSLGEYSEHILRPDGRVPFNYDKVVAYAPNPSSTPQATDKEATYQTAWLSLWMQSLTGMSYKPGASGGTQKLCSSAEQYWFEAGPVMSYWRDGYTNLWNAIKADLDFGSPIQVNSPGHQMVVDGYAIENEGTDSEVHYVNINYGWGSPEGWVNLLTAVTENTAGGRLADFQIGYRPQKIVQFEPVPKVCTSEVTLKWHLPPCYTNRTIGFAVEIAKDGGEPTVDNVATHEETTTYTATGLANGSTYTFTVIPLMSDGSESRSNSATTTIGTPKAAPEILSVSSVACGIDLMQQGLFVECGRGITNKINVACSTSVTRLDAYSSHLTVLPDSKVSCVDNGGGNWIVNVDAASMSKDWDGDMLILTLVAANADGTEAYKNLMLRFNSIRNVLGGTFEIVETSATSPVWFASGTTTTLDAKGQVVTFDANAFNGAGTVVLTDSVGNGSFTFQRLDGFTGTLKWAPSVTVNLPADMSGFAGTLYFNSPAGNYTLSSDLPSTAKIYIGNNTQLTPGNVTINAAVTGRGILNIAGVDATFNNLKGFEGSVSLGTFDSAGTLTLRAGEEKNVEIWNGTLYLTLDKAQVAYGYSTSQITELESYTGSKLVFQDENGKVLQTWTSSLAEYKIAASANTWFPDAYGTGSFYDGGRWSQGLPSAGDYVIFNDSFGDSEMTLDLPTDFNLGYVKVVGTKFNIKAGDGTATLTVDTLENEVQTKIKTDKFLPETVIPQAKLFVASGITLDCEIDHSIANNIRDPNDLEGLYWESCWHGTVVFTDYADSTMPGLDLTFWGNSNSTIRLNGFTGRLIANKTIPYTVELVDNGTSPALHWSTGTKGATSTFEALTGDGIFKTSGGTAENVLLKDVSGFTGQFQLAAKTVAIASTMPTEYTGENGKLHVCQSATIAPGAIWNIGGGVYFGSGCNLDIYGQLWSLTAAMATYGEGAVVTLEDGAVIRAAVAMSGDYAPTLNFKAGTYQFEGNLTETKTVNFCAAAGKYTTLDANGHTVTLGANFFSGSGDVYLKTSTSGGTFVIQGIPASYTGTIYVDNSIGLTISGDISQMGGKINISDITLSRNSSNIGKIDVCSGATLQVVLTDDEAMEGFTVTGVTLNGGTIEFVDQRGTVVGSSTESLVYVKPEDYTVPSPEPTAIWYGDFSATVDGYTLTDWQQTHGENMSSVTIDRNNQGLLVDFASAKGYFTVLVKYTNLVASTSSKRVLFATTANSDQTRDRCGIRLLADSKVQGLWNAATDSNSDSDYGSASSGTVPSSGTLAFVYDKDASGTSAYVAENDSALSGTALWNNTALKAGVAYGFAAGGMCRDAAVSGVEAAKGMTITGLAIFDRVLTASELKYFRWPEEEEEPEEPITVEVSPASGAVAAGTKMTVTCSDPDATIWYKNLMDADYTEYTEPVALATGINYYYVKVNDGEATLYTYVVAAPDPGPVYEGPDPVAVWVAGEFDDDRSAHGGLEFSLNGNTTNEFGQIVIANDATTGATIALPTNTFTKASVLVKYELTEAGAPVANAAPVGVISTDGYPIVPVCTTAGGTSLTGAYLNKGNSYALVNNNGSYWPFTSTPTISSGEGYVLLSYHSEPSNPMTHGTAVYAGPTINTLTGGNASGLQWKGYTIDKMAIGGPTTAGGASPWKGMVIKGVALFTDEWLVPSDLANYTFPAQGAVRPVDSDRYTIEPVVSWVNDFKTTTKGDYTLSVSGTTAVKDDTFGGTLTIGDAAAVVDVRNGANGGNLTVLVKYRATSATVNAPVVTFGETLSNSVKIDVGAYTQSARTLAVNRSYNGGNNKWVALNTAASLNEGVGYLLCARKSNDMLVYVGDSFDSMTGGSTAAPGDISYSCDLIQAVGIGGPSGLPNADSAWSPFTGFVVEKVVVFNGYYTPADLTSFNVKAGETKSFTAGETEEYPAIGTLSSSGTIKIANAAELTEGTYTLATWSTPKIMSSGYGRVGTLTAEGLPSGLTAELVYGVKAIYLRVYDAAAFAARPKFKIMPYGDSITEGFNLGDSKANYRVLLGQKLSMLGYNVEMVGCYNKIQSKSGTDTFFDAIDPSGAVATNIWQWHSAKHGATLGVTALTSWQRSALTENVDTISAMAGKPDVVLLLGGINDLSPGFDAPATVFGNWTNVVSRLVKNLPDTKIVVTTTLHAGPGRTDSLNTNADNFNTLIKSYINDMPAAWSGHVYFVDLCDAVKSAETGVISSDNLHPDWLGDDQMAEGWLSVITNLYPSADGVFPSSTPLPSVSDSELGAAAKSELADYRNGYKLCRTIIPTGNIDTANPYSTIGDGATNYIEKVAYFVEYVRADNNAHKWVWIDMDAFGNCDLESVGLPAANRQQVVTKLHVKSNHNGIDDVAANDDTVSGWIEFSPYDYTGNASGVQGAPLRHGAATGDYTMFDWDDTLSASGSMGSMQVFRKAPTTGRPAQVLFAYNNWRSSTSEAEFGIGNFAQHFWGGPQTLDYTYTKGLAKMNASAYSVKRIEIWTKGKVTDTDYPTPYAWIDMYFPELVSGWDSTQYNDFATNKNHSSVKNGYAPWESYVLGLEPTNETSRFLATIRMNGTTPIVEYSPTNTTLGNITYVLQGKPALSNDWQNVEFDEPGATNRFFRVKVTW